MRLFYLLPIILLVVGCKKQEPEPPPPPQIIITALPNDVFQVQWDNGDPLNTSDLMPVLDKWLKEHPNRSITSTIPQVTYTTINGKQVGTTHGVLIFTTKHGDDTPKAPDKPDTKQ